MVNRQKRDRKAMNISRRSFLGLAWTASLAGLFTQAAIAMLKFIRPRIGAGEFGGKIVAGRVEEFKPGSISHVQQGRFYIARLEDGGALALWHRCTHLGCTVPWREQEGRFLCPCHSSIFSRTGEVLSGPAPRPLDLFPLVVEDGQIVVDTGSPIERDRFDPTQATYLG
jgi:cytochrome b6-f complex iron-sulfur subunit